MSIRNHPTPQSLSEMRRAGRELQDKGLFEFNLSTGAISWTNEFILEKLGYTTDQIRHMTIYDLVPSEFQDSLSESITDRSVGRHRNFSIWPTKTVDKKIAWWYVYKSKTEYPVAWNFAEFVQTTSNEGVEYTFMRITMDNANSYVALHSRVEEIDHWIRDQVTRLDAEDGSIKASISNLDDKMKRVMTSASQAASSSLEAVKAVKEMEGSINGRFDNHEAEILKLISTDVHHDRRLLAFEKQVQATANTAIKSIETQADKAGKSLSRKIVIPVSAIGALFTFIQWLLNHWLSK